MVSRGRYVPMVDSRPDPLAQPWRKSELRIIDADGQSPLLELDWTMTEPHILDIKESLVEQYILSRKSTQDCEGFTLTTVKFCDVLQCGINTLDRFTTPHYLWCTVKQATTNFFLRPLNPGGVHIG
jgi:hypothetical protein